MDEFNHYNSENLDNLSFAKRWDKDSKNESLLFNKNILENKEKSSSPWNLPPTQIVIKSNDLLLQKNGVNRINEKLELSIQKTRNNKVQQQSNTETIDNKVGQLNWICDQK